MASTVSHYVNGSKATLTVPERFDFSIHRDFRAHYESILATNGVRELDIDLSNVDYVDSSALGMLLLLREKSMGANIQLKLSKPRSAVRQVLETANFGRLFTIT